MVVSKQPMPAAVEVNLPKFVEDIIEYLGLEETDQITPDDLSIAGYYVAGSKAAFVAYEYTSDDQPALAVIQLDPQSKSFQDTCVFSWGRDEGQSIEDALGEFLEMNPPD